LQVKAQKELKSACFAWCYPLNLCAPDQYLKDAYTVGKKEDYNISLSSGNISHPLWYQGILLHLGQFSKNTTNARNNSKICLLKILSYKMALAFDDMYG
jgi:hypothetical protein